MNMKLNKIILSSAFVIFIATAGFAVDKVHPDIKRTPVPAESPAAIRAQQLIKRLEEIKAMDLKAMSKKEKRELRAEIKSIKHEMKEMHDGGVYISVGGIIIILLLLILLL